MAFDVSMGGWCGREGSDVWRIGIDRWMGGISCTDGWRGGRVSGLGRVAVGDRRVDGRYLMYCWVDGMGASMGSSKWTGLVPGWGDGRLYGWRTLHGRVDEWMDGWR